MNDSNDSIEVERFVEKTYEAREKEFSLYEKSNRIDQIKQKFSRVDNVLSELTVPIVDKESEYGSFH